MIILHESYDLDPASPEQVDAFIALAEKTLVPAAARLGARLIGAFRPLREVAPKERLVSWAALPYSPLR